VKIFNNEQEMRTKRAQNAANGCLDSPKLGGRALPEPAGGACSAPPNPLAGFRGEGWDGREGQGGRDEMGKGGIGPPTFWLLLPPMVLPTIYSVC